MLGPALAALSDVASAIVKENYTHGAITRTELELQGETYKQISLGS